MTSASIEDVAEFVLDGTHGSPARTESGIPVLSAQNVRDGVLTYETDRYTSLVEYEEFKKRLPLRRGDVLLTIVGTIGRAAVLEEVRPLVFQRSVAVIRPREDFLHPRFLYHVSQIQIFQAQLSRASNQSSQAGVYLGRLKKLRIPLPPLPEQRRIVDILDKAEALRAKRRAALAQLDSVTQSIFLDMFGDPATNPKRWPRAVLGDVIFSASDGPHVSPAYTEDRENGIPFLSTRHVRAGELSWNDLKFIMSEDAEVQWRKCRPEIGDVLYTKGGTTGLAATVKTDRPFAVWVHIALLKPDPAKVESVWLENMLNSDFCYRQSQVLTHGIANRDLGLTRMVKIKLYRPPLQEQQRFVRRADAAAHLKARQRAALAELDALFVSLQHRAFHGEL
jgi:type I restriction enzyme S subunit